MNFMITTPARLGDTIFITPSIRLLKKIYPDANIDVIAISQLAADVLEGSPFIRELFVMPSMESLSEKVNDYNVKINIHPSEKASQYLSLFNAKEFKYEPSKKDRKRHRAEYLLSFIARNFPSNLEKFNPHYDLFPTADHHASLQTKLLDNRADFGSLILIGLHMGCHGLAKKRSRLWGKFSHKKAWPIKNFIKLASMLNSRYEKACFVLTGSNDEVLLGEEFSKKIPNTVNFINQLSILELTSLMHYLKLFITNDTGALHVACATEVNLIALFGPSNSILHGPFPPQRNRLLIQKNPIRKIKVNDVCQQCITLLNET